VQSDYRPTCQRVEGLTETVTFLQTNGGVASRTEGSVQLKDELKLLIEPRYKQKVVEKSGGDGDDGGGDDGGGGGWGGVEVVEVIMMEVMMAEVEVGREWRWWR
jgi:hypothetical protein